MLILLAIACRDETPPPFVRGPLGGPPPEVVPEAPADPDADGDGVVASADCDDRDPAIHPGALERCNGIDDACDGGTDDGAVSIVGGRAYATLAEAIGVAPAGAEVRVCPGRHVGPFSIQRPMTVTASDGPDATLLDGANGGRVLAIRADGVEVRGFTITRGVTGYQELEGGGGGVYVAPEVEATLADVVITGNSTDGDGGGLLVGARARVTFQGELVGNVAQAAGAARRRAGASLVGGTVSANQAVLGGGVGLEPDAELVAVEVADNFASAGGGGVYSVGGDVRLTDVEVRGNESAWQGGGVSVQAGLLRLDGTTTILGNHAGHAGGGVELFEATVVGGRIEDNTAHRLGGGVYGTLATIVGATIEGNVADRGGGVATEGGGVELDGAMVRENEGGLGGGVYVGSTAVVTGSSIVQNEAASGGAVYVAGGGAVSVTDTDLGAGEADNAPDDIAVENGHGLEAQADALYCDAYGCW